MIELTDIVIRELKARKNEAFVNYIVAYQFETVQITPARERIMKADQYAWQEMFKLYDKLKADYNEGSYQ